MLVEDDPHIFLALGEVSPVVVLWAMVLRLSPFTAQEDGRERKLAQDCQRRREHARPITTVCIGKPFATVEGCKTHWQKTFPHPGDEGMAMQNNVLL